MPGLCTSPGWCPMLSLAVMHSTRVSSDFGRGRTPLWWYWQYVKSNQALHQSSGIFFLELLVSIFVMQAQSSARGPLSPGEIDLFITSRSRKITSFALVRVAGRIPPMLFHLDEQWPQQQPRIQYVTWPHAPSSRRHFPPLTTTWKHLFTVLLITSCVLPLPLACSSYHFSTSR